MGSFLKKLWNDENFFMRAAAVLLTIAGYGFTTGLIPTGVDGLGPKVGAAVNAVAIGVATGKWQFGDGAK